MTISLEACRIYSAHGQEPEKGNYMAIVADFRGEEMDSTLGRGHDEYSFLVCSKGIQDDEMGKFCLPPCESSNC